MKKSIFFIVTILITLHLAAVTRDFPFMENFDSTENTPGTTMPEGWTFEDTNSDNVVWDILTPADPNYVHSQPNSMHMAFGFSQAMNDWLFTPALSFEPGSSYQLHFWVRCGLDIFTNEASPEKLRVSFGTAASSAAMTTELYVDELVDNLNFEQITIDISVTEAAEYFIGFQSFSDPGGFILAIDDVEIEQLSANDNVELAPCLLGSYPNPFNPQTTISFNLYDYDNASLEIFNVRGQKVAAFAVNNSQNHVVWNAEDQPSGIYMINLKSRGIALQTQKISLIK